MNAQELLETLKSAGLEGEAIKSLLAEALELVNTPNEEEKKQLEEQDAQERAEASKMLGVNL